MGFLYIQKLKLDMDHIDLKQPINIPAMILLKEHSVCQH